MKVIGFYDRFDATSEGDEGFAWDEVYVLCRRHAEKALLSWETKDLGDTAEGTCDYCRQI